MKLKSLNRYISLTVFLISFLPVYAEEQIDIWSIEKKKESKKIEINKKDSNSSINSEVFSETKFKNKIQIENEILQDEKDIKLFGIYEPADSNLDLNMWSETSAEKVRSSLSRINKLKLSKSASNFFEKTIFSFSYPPKDMSDEEFINLKINWMVENKRSDLIEKFLNQNNTFHNKGKIIQYLVDENIAKASIKEGCEKISFIDKTIKDSYLEKFKIYCLIFDNKKNEAQLLYDILKEQNLSDKFFDDKINFLFGIKNKVNKEIMDNNLLNFYLSSITIENFKYEPNKKTKKIIWEYLNAANLIQLDDLQDKEKLKSLEIAANQSQFDKKKIFDIYKKIPFDLNNLMNADNIYQSLLGSDARALIYQKFLLSDNNEKKVKLLFLLKDLFKKDNLSNVYIKFMSDRLQEIDLTSIPESYKESVQNNIVSEEIYKLGKIKYEDKALHRSRIIKYFTENVEAKKIQKDLDKIYKKIKRDKKYFFSAKDLALIEALAKDGFKIPKDLKYKEMGKKYDVPSGLLQLIEKNEPAFLVLKIVEIIGEDEIYDLDSETIYFISHLLNQINLNKFRNEVLISALPLRTQL